MNLRHSLCYIHLFGQDPIDFDDGMPEQPYRQFLIGCVSNPLIIAYAYSNARINHSIEILCILQVKEI